MKEKMAVKLVRWDPYRDLARRREEMDRMFEEFFLPSRAWEGPSKIAPEIDIIQDEKEIKVKASLPGVKPEDVDVHISGDMLTIKAKTTEEKETKEADYLVKELRYGEFSRSITLPVAVNAEKAEAVFENGVLTLTLPKQEAHKARQIKVKAKPAIGAAKK